MTLVLYKKATIAMEKSRLRGYSCHRIVFLYAAYNIQQNAASVCVIPSIFSINFFAFAPILAQVLRFKR